MSGDWRAAWAIRELKAVKRDVGDQYHWTWICSMEREATRTVIHSPGRHPVEAIETGWVLAKMVEDATNV